MLEPDSLVRSHGLGNDYLVADPSRLSFPLTPETVRALCDRHRGVGSDGVLAFEPGVKGTEARLRIFNPDGSEAEKSGNGLRIFCKFLYEHGYTRKERFTVATAGGEVEAVLYPSGGRVCDVAVEMGRATFEAAHIPAEGFEGEVVEKPLRVEGPPGRREFQMTCVNVGNPHCVVFAEDPEDPDVRTWGPLIETHPQFPRRINVQFARVDGPQNVTLRIWERGAGYTLASGSSSCAVAAAAVKTGRTHRSLLLHMPGGDLSVEVGEDFSLRMRGPVEEVGVVQLSRDFVDRLQAFP